VTGLLERISVGEGRYRVTLEAHITDGNGLCVFLHGGESSHVGGVALAVPRMKSSHDGLTCDLSQICAPGHKDVSLASQIAQLLAIASNQTVSVTVGIHVDNADPEGIQELVANAHKAAGNLIAKQSWE